MKRVLLVATAPLAVLVLLAVLHEHGFAHALGVDTQASQQYDFVSGVGPMILTALSMTTIVSGLWSAHNCHATGCWRIGRHKVKGTPWCNHHHEQARAEDTLEDKLSTLITLMLRRENRDEA